MQLPLKRELRSEVRNWASYGSSDEDVSEDFGADARGYVQRRVSSAFGLCHVPISPFRLSIKPHVGRELVSQTTLDDTLGQYHSMLRDTLTYMNARQPVARDTAYEEMVKPHDDSCGRRE